MKYDLQINDICHGEFSKRQPFYRHRTFPKLATISVSNIEAINKTLLD